MASWLAYLICLFKLLMEMLRFLLLSSLPLRFPKIGPIKSGTILLTNFDPLEPFDIVTFRSSSDWTDMEPLMDLLGISLPLSREVSFIGFIVHFTVFFFPTLYTTYHISSFVVCFRGSTHTCYSDQVYSDTPIFSFLLLSASQLLVVCIVLNPWYGSRLL